MFHFARLILEHISSHEFRDFPPSLFRNLEYLSLRCWGSSNLNLSCLFLVVRFIPQEFDYLVRRSQAHKLARPSRLYALVDPFLHLERLSFLNFHLYFSPRPSLKFRTHSSFTGEPWISMSTDEGLVLLSRISRKPRGLALEYTGHPITRRNHFPARRTPPVDGYGRTDSRCYLRFINHSSDVGFVVVLGRCLLDPCLILIDFSFYYRGPEGFDNQTSRFTTSAASAVTSLFGHDIIRFYELL